MSTLNVVLLVAVAGVAAWAVARIVRGRQRQETGAIFSGAVLLVGMAFIAAGILMTG